METGKQVATNIDTVLAKKSFAAEYCVVFALLGISPLLWMQSIALWERTHFQFYPIAWLGYGWLLYANADISGILSLYRLRVGIATILVAASMATFAAVQVSPWSAQVAAILLLLGWSMIRLSETAWTRLVAWSLLLWVTVPLPLGYDSLLIQRLQQVSSVSAAHMLDLLGTPHLRLGNLLDIRSAQLFVDEACSGVDSLYSLAAIAIFVIVHQRVGLVVALILLSLVPCWAWLGNTVRLTSIAWLLDNWQGVLWTRAVVADQQVGDDRCDD